MKLFMAKVGATLPNRLIEQHDVFFGVAEHIGDLKSVIAQQWCDASSWHLDAYRPVTKVGDYQVRWLADGKLCDEQGTDRDASSDGELKLFFINLGGYRDGQFEEFHHKMLIVAKNQAQAAGLARQSDFYHSFSMQSGQNAMGQAVTAVNATSHIDDKLQVAVDEIYDVNGLICQGQLVITPIAAGECVPEDVQTIGYIKL